MQAESLSEAAKAKLREVAGALDPLKLLEEIRAVQAHLAALADGEIPPSVTTEPPDLAAFVSGLSSAWRGGEVRPTFSIEAKPRYLRSLQKVAQRDPMTAKSQSAAASSSDTPGERVPERPPVIYAAPGTAQIQALRMVWPLVCRRLESFPNISATQLFEELCVQFPGRFTPRQYRTLVRCVKLWRRDARARGVVIGPIKQRRLTNKPRGRRPDLFKAHWAEMVEYLEAQPDQTALQLLIEFSARYPDRYSLRNLSALQRRVKIRRHEAVQRLICETKYLTENVTVAEC